MLSDVTCGLCFPAALQLTLNHQPWDVWLFNKALRLHQKASESFLSLSFSFSLPPSPAPPSSSQYISLWPVFQSGASMQIKSLRSAANNLWNVSCTSSHSCRSMVALTSKGNRYFKNWLTVNISLSEHCNPSKALCEWWMGGGDWCHSSSG